MRDVTPVTRDVCFINLLPVLQGYPWDRHAPAWLLEPGWSPALPGGGRWHPVTEPPERAPNAFPGYKALAYWHAFWHYPRATSGPSLALDGGRQGLMGIACAKTFQAQVTGLDADAAVFPYLQLHAQRNGVHIATRHGTFAGLTPQDLAAFELIVGADICFWEELVDPLYQLVRHSVAAGVAEILLADPSRPPFDELCARCVEHGDA